MVIGCNLASDFALDDNGEFHTVGLWKRYPARRGFTVPISRGGKLIRREIQNLNCSVVRAYQGKREWVCRKKTYANYVVRTLNKGRNPVSEAKFCEARLYDVRRLYNPESETYLFYHRDTLIRVFRNCIEADAYLLWHADRRALRHRPEREVDAYQVFRKAEKLDKPMVDRVYEILSTLKGEGNDHTPSEERTADESDS